ncbi:hypothetical protein JCM6882_003273 [Rhodosporidiobolus microsporus]
MASVDFSYLSETLAADSELRERVRDAVREVEAAERSCTAVLGRVHSSSKDQIPQLLTSLDPTLPALRSSLANLARLIPKEQFYRYSDSFSRAMQTASYIVVLRAFLEREEVASKGEVAEALGIKDEWRDHFFLSTEEYLHSLISLVNELSRLAINRVTLGDYDAPVRYSRFAKELSNAFGLLNLKNDSLRKRFDSIKYDVKRLEEVVYDLSLRGLLPNASSQTQTQGQGGDASAQGDGPAAKRARKDEDVKPMETS